MKKVLIGFIMSINLKPNHKEWGRNFTVLSFGSSRKPLNKARTLVCGALKVFLILLFTLSLIASFVESSDLIGSKRNNMQVNEKLNASPELRVLIKISNFSDNKNSRMIGSDLNYKTKEQIKNNLIDKIGKDKIRNDFGDSFSAEISSEDLEILRDVSGVESVSIIGTRKIFLQDSVPLINASLAHSLLTNSINLTGKGQTICIIDTGVNYSHSDLGGCYGNNDASSNCKVLGGWDYYNSDSDPMDDNGHGTHVAGIAAANGTITGVAPEAKIIMIKACDSTGLICADDAINAGINWCVNNASIFNISVISMSLGGGVYTNYCNDDYLASAINSAVAKNISVTIATGNDGSYTDISAPACVQTATPVSATNKNDTIALYANTNWMVQLLAPGGDNSGVKSREINSTWITGKYNQISGTSMATPHVAGAIAIINQYLSLTGKTRTPAQIETALNITGKVIQDVGYSELNFSRIDIYLAIDYFEIPSINYSIISSDTSGSIVKRRNILVNVSASDLGFKNLTIKLYNSSNALVNSSNTTATFLFANFTGLTDGIYSFNATVYDIWGNINSTIIRNITIKNSLYAFSIISPINNSWHNGLRLNVTLGESGNCTFSLNHGANITMNASNSTNFFYINSSLVVTSTNGTYNVTFYCNDSIGNFNLSNIIFFGVEKTAPVLNSTSSSKDSSSATIAYTVNESVNAYVDYGTSISLGSVSSNSNFLESGTVTLSSLSASTLYYYNLTICDPAGNCAVNGTYNITTDATPPTSGGGGGGGGSTTSSETYTPSLSETAAGYTKPLAKNDQISFTSFSGDSHSLTLNNVGSSYADLTVRSNPINLTLYFGNEKKLNLTSSDYYDLSLKLNSIENNKANITMKVIYELIPKAYVNNSANETMNQTNNSGQNASKNSNNKLYIYAIAVVIIAVIIFILAKTLINKKIIKNKTKNKFKKH